MWPTHWNRCFLCKTCAVPLGTEMRRAGPVPFGHPDLPTLVRSRVLSLTEFRMVTISMFVLDTGIRVHSCV